MHLTKLSIAAACTVLLGTAAMVTPAFAGNEGECKSNCSPPPSSDGNSYNAGGNGYGGNGYGGNGYGGDGGTGIGYGGQGGKGYGGDGGNANNNGNYNGNNGNNNGYNGNNGNNNGYNGNNGNNNGYNGNNGNNGHNGNLKNVGNSNQRQHQSQEQSQYQSQSVSDSGNSSVSINNERPPVSTAYSAPLVAGEDTCMGSSSLGGQGVGFGLTIGTTWTDTNCQRLKNSRHLASLGFSRAAVALVCVDEDVQKAMQAAGTPCPMTQQQRSEVEPARGETHDRSAARDDSDAQHVAQNAFVAPVVQAAPEPAYRFVPMKPIKN